MSRVAFRLGVIGGIGMVIGIGIVLVEFRGFLPFHSCALFCFIAWCRLVGRVVETC